MSETTAVLSPALASSPGEQCFWKISPGHGGQFWKQFRMRKFIAIGWDDVGDVRELNPTSEDELLRHLPTERFTKGERSRRYAAEQVWKFYGLMKPGDLVCAYGKGKVLGWGKIIGPYEHTTDDFHFRHRRAVEWESVQATSIKGVSSELNQKVRLQNTIIQMTAWEFTDLQNPPSVQTLPGAKMIDEPTTSGSSDACSALYAAFSDIGLYFTHWQIATFYTALQTKGFTILSGISGTGKTKLVQHFASIFPQPAKIPVPNKEQIVLRVNPSTLKFGNFVIPMHARQMLGLLELEANRDVVVTYGKEKCPSRLNKSSGDKAISLLMRAPVSKWFNNTFKEGDRFILEPQFNREGEGELTGLGIIPEADWEASPSVPTLEEPNWLFLPVRPDWRDGKALLGYFNPLTGSYEWTPFLRFLLRAVQSYRKRDGLAWFVILDEMNLAHVEYYFADLLSVLESGRNDEGWTREPLRPAFPEDAEGDLPPDKIFVPPNLHIVGTVNIDETTHAFSPKVLDRAFGPAKQ